MSYFRVKSASWINAAGGAVVGAGAGALGGRALTKDESNTSRNMIRGAIAGGLAGAGIGKTFFKNKAVTEAVATPAPAQAVKPLPPGVTKTVDKDGTTVLNGVLSNGSNTVGNVTKQEIKNTTAKAAEIVSNPTKVSTKQSVNTVKNKMRQKNKTSQKVTRKQRLGQTKQGSYFNYLTYNYY